MEAAITTKNILTCELLGLTESRVNTLYNTLLQKAKARIASGKPHPYGLDDDTVILTLEMFSWKRIQYSQDKEGLRHILDFMIDMGI